MNFSSDERNAELREIFFDSAQELLQALNEEALKLEKQANDPEVVRTIRRIVHTLKGDAAACGFRELSELAHLLEDAFADSTAPAQASLAEIAFAAADTFAAMLSAYQHGHALPSSEQLCGMIGAAPVSPAPEEKVRKKKARPVAPSATLWTEYEKLATKLALEKQQRVYHITAQIDPNCAMPIAGRQMVVNALGTLGEILASRPEDGSTQKFIKLEFLIATQKSAEAVSGACRIPSVISNVSVAALKENARPRKKAEAPVAAEELSLAAPEESASLDGPVASAPVTKDNQHLDDKTLAAQSPENILRVDAEKIDNVLNLVGELIIGKSMLQQVLNEFAKQFPKEGIRGRFADAMAFQSRVLNDLQRSVMKVRMVPVEQLFRRFPRMVRDVSRQCGRDVQLVIKGEETDLDKSILDAIAEPLTHLVRNSISHGIEDTSERVRAGKPAHGTIRLNASYQGNQVVIEVTDDGRGIDVHSVKAKAVERSIVTQQDVARMTESEILELIFRPGFSTAEAITEVAGRGVGLDVVQSVLRRLKGTVDIDTQPGQGTTFRLKLPLTLAIIKALMFRVEHRLYAVPLNAVAEIARANESDIHQIDTCEVLQLRNQVLPLVRLGRVAAQRVENRSNRIFVLVIAVGERKLGLIVDALEGEEELVIKALDDHTVATDLISGASILGDGRVVLILNLAEIVERFGKARPSQTDGEVAAGLLLSHADRVLPPRAGSEARQ